MPREELLRGRLESPHYLSAEHDTLNDYDYSYSFSIRFRTSLKGNISGSRLLATVAAGTRVRKLAQLGPERALVDTTLIQALRLSLANARSLKPRVAPGQ